MKNNYTIEINATPEQVFYWLDDNERQKKWIPNLVENENIQETENKVGTTYRQVYLENGRRMEMEGTLTVYEPNRRLSTEIKGDAFDLHVDIQLKDLDGRTEVNFTSEVFMKKTFMRLIGFLFRPFIKKAQSKQNTTNLSTLKQLAENPA